MFLNLIFSNALKMLEKKKKKNSSREKKNGKIYPRSFGFTITNNAADGKFMQDYKL